MRLQSFSSPWDVRNVSKLEQSKACLKSEKNEAPTYLRCRSQYRNRRQKFRYGLCPSLGARVFLRQVLARAWTNEKCFDASCTMLKATFLSKQWRCLLKLLISSCCDANAAFTEPWTRRYLQDLRNNLIRKVGAGANSANWAFFERKPRVECCGAALSAPLQGPFLLSSPITKDDRLAPLSWCLRHAAAEFVEQLLGRRVAWRSNAWLALGAGRPTVRRVQVELRVRWPIGWRRLGVHHFLPFGWQKATEKMQKVQDGFYASAGIKDLDERGEIRTVISSIRNKWRVVTRQGSKRTLTFYATKQHHFGWITSLSTLFTRKAFWPIVE